MITALCVRRTSIYKELGIDAYDDRRDMRTWKGGNSVIAHPPCAQWSRLRGLATKNESIKNLAIECIAAVRQWGGVLEHPKFSKLYPDHLPLPGRPDPWGGYSIVVNQHWWGHRAKKETILYIVGCAQRELPDIPMSLDAITHKVGSNYNKRLKSLNKKETEATPAEFAKWLIQVAEICDRNMKVKNAL